MVQNQHPIRLLLVDDEPDFLAALSRRLGKRGARVREATSGREALDLLAQEEADVVISDVKMAGMDGLALLEAVHQGYPGTEVILLTGQASVQDGVAGIKAGAFDYLTKPVELDHLQGKIAQAYRAIQHRRQLAREQELRSKLEKRLASAEHLASLGTLAMGVAHEINNPLAIISESTGWLRQRAARQERVPQQFRDDLDLAVQKIEAGVERAKGITHQLLDLARKGELELQELDVCQLMEEVRALCSKQAQEAGVELVLECVPLLLWSDPQQLRQVLVKLVSNALQASDSGGSVRLSARQQGQDAVLSIEDQGHGIARENLQRIFEPFFSTRPVGQGSGLGLCVSSGIVEKLGGRIEVDSRLGAGATFRVILPLRPIQELDTRVTSCDSDDSTAAAGQTSQAGRV